MSRKKIGTSIIRHTHIRHPHSNFPRITWPHPWPPSGKLEPPRILMYPDCTWSVRQECFTVAIGLPGEFSRLYKTELCMLSRWLFTDRWLQRRRSGCIPRARCIPRVHTPVCSSRLNWQIVCFCNISFAAARVPELEFDQLNDMKSYLIN